MSTRKHVWLLLSKVDVVNLVQVVEPSSETTAKKGNILSVK